MKPRRSGSRESRTADTAETAEVHGHTIVIRRRAADAAATAPGGALQLYVDGVRVPFVAGERSFLVGYVEAESLLEAASKYVERRFAADRADGGER